MRGARRVLYTDLPNSQDTIYTHSLGVFVRTEHALFIPLAMIIAYLDPSGYTPLLLLLRTIIIYGFIHHTRVSKWVGYASGYCYHTAPPSYHLHTDHILIRISISISIRTCLHTYLHVLRWADSAYLCIQYYVTQW